MKRSQIPAGRVAKHADRATVRLIGQNGGACVEIDVDLSVAKEALATEIARIRQKLLDLGIEELE